jgi:uncharacterized protein YndB with AHSA1/START domain
MEWTTQATFTSAATPVQVWARWTDVDKWNEWDHEVVSSSLDGPFELGTTGSMKPRGGPPVRFTLTEVKPNAAFSDTARLPLTSLEFHHTVSPDGAGSNIEHRVVMRGPLTFLFKRIVGVKIERGLPHTVASLATLAAKTSTHSVTLP